jgi:putative oxygen-independent coproporphyrinogen III oxidase
MLPLPPPYFGLYVHWPFCLSKCPYCDFNSHVRGEDQAIAPYVDGLIVQLTTMVHHFLAPHAICRSIFIGGGTPSLLPPAQLARLLEAIHGLCRVDPLCEITMEANPTSVERQHFIEARAAGINRVSIGVQSLDPEELAFLGREHSPEDAIEAVRLASRIFPRYSLDAIYALPGQSMQSWDQSLTSLLDLTGDHLSLYQLTIEKGTAFYADHQRGAWSLPDPDLAAEMFSLTHDRLRMVGLCAYEVSNFARKEQESQHNLHYWRYHSYLGIGPGAHSRLHRDVQWIDRAVEDCAILSSLALTGWHHPDRWLASVQSDGLGLQQQQVLTSSEIASEATLMGLRLTEGMHLASCEARTGVCVPDYWNNDALRRMIDFEYLVLTEKGLRTTSKGMMVLDRLVETLLKH